MRFLTAAILALAAVACMQSPQTYRDLDKLGRDYQREVATAPQTAAEATSRDSCGAGRFAHLVGTPAAQIDRATLPARARVITPDMLVTQDFSAERLNVMVGNDGKVGSLACY